MMNECLNEVECCEVLDRDNLAVVGRIERLEAIPNKDKIELVFIKDSGYTFICEKIHKVNDLVVYIKYDTVLPKNELFEWMKDSKYRVKSKSFTERDEEDNIVKKIYSQGIVLPIQVVIDFLTKQGHQVVGVAKHISWQKQSDILKLYDYFYKDASVFFKIKKEKFEKFKEYYNERNNHN